MGFEHRIFSEGRVVSALLFFISCGSLGAAYFAEYIMDLKPCILCLYQRYVYMAAGLGAFLGILYPNRWIILLIMGTFLAGMGIAFYQVGIENNLFQLPSICQSVIKEGSSLEAMKEQLLHQPMVSCDKPGWSLLGISMAGYNMFFSMVLMIYCFVAFRKVSP